MSSITPETVSKIADLQPKVWQLAASAATEAWQRRIQFSSPLTMAVNASDLVADSAQPAYVGHLQFHADAGSQLIVLPEHTAAALAPGKGKKSRSPDAKLVEALMRAIAGGIAGALGADPGSFQVKCGFHETWADLVGKEELIKVQVAISSDEVAGTALWLIDQSTAARLAGLGLSGAPQTAERHSPSAPQAQTSPQDARLDMLLDIPLEVTVQLGHARMLVKDVVELGAGSIVQMDRSAGDPADVLVNGQLVARGEVVVVGDIFGVRITEIVPPAERASKLREAA